MPIVISGTNGISGVDGTASNPSYEGTDANTGVFFPAADTVAIGTNGTEALRVDSAGNVGVGVTPSPWGSGRKAIQINGSVGYLALSNSTSGGYTYWNMYNDGTNNIAITTGSIAAYGVNPSGQHVWFNGTGTASTNASGLTQAMTLDASGNLGLGSTPGAWGTQWKALQINTGASLYGASTFTIVGQNIEGRTASDNYISTGAASRYMQVGGEHVWNIAGSGSAGGSISFSQPMKIDSSGRLLFGALSFSQTTFTSGSAYFDANIFVGNNSGTAGRNVRIDVFQDEFYIVWANGNTDNNFIRYAYNGTAWVNVSDETLKDIIEPITNAVEKVSSLRAVIGKYKTEDEGARHPFLIAQDVQQVLPEAVYLSKSRTEGEPDTLGVGYTDVIPLLVAAIKEQQQMIETLQAKVAALEAK